MAVEKSKSSELHDSVMSTLEEYGKKIGRRSSEEDCSLSKKIIRLYEMYYNCSDSMTLVLLNERVKEWLEKYDSNEGDE